MKSQADIGLVGLGTMGENLALNLKDHQWRTALYNRHGEKVSEFMEAHKHDSMFIPCMTPEELCNSLKTPRRILLTVKSGSAVDEMLQTFIPLLDKGDIIIDGGNSDYRDTTRRSRYLEEHGIHFIGLGISGGMDGARYGASLMAGGTKAGLEPVKEILLSIAAVTAEGEVCCLRAGTDGAGHFLKMVHNGIEYAEMQLIAETYALLKHLLHWTPEHFHQLYRQWNDSGLHSYLLEITADIFRMKDVDSTPLIDHILDAAKQKGTGQWSVQSALEIGAPVPCLAQAVFARHLSSMREERQQASAILDEVKVSAGNHFNDSFADSVRAAYQASRLCIYAQGFQMLKMGAEYYHWEGMKMDEIATVWQAGCIIRSDLLKEIRKAYESDPTLQNLLLAPDFHHAATNDLRDWRITAATGISQGIPLPCITAALNYYDTLICTDLPANLIQAQRDYFGHHGFERNDRPRGEVYHLR